MKTRASPSNRKLTWLVTAIGYALFAGAFALRVLTDIQEWRQKKSGKPIL